MDDLPDDCAGNHLTHQVTLCCLYILKLYLCDCANFPGDLVFYILHISILHLLCCSVALFSCYFRNTCLHRDPQNSQTSKNCTITLLNTFNWICVRLLEPLVYSFLVQGHADLCWKWKNKKSHIYFSSFAERWSVNHFENSVRNIKNLEREKTPFDGLIMTKNNTIWRSKDLLTCTWSCIKSISG